MRSVWFIVPAFGRLPLTAVCLRQLARTCEALAGAGVAARAVVVADDANLEVADYLGFGTVRRENKPLGRKWNDGYQLAGENGADFVVPLGSDDWIDPDLVLAQMDADGEIRCSRRSAIVSEDGSRIALLNISYEGGDGVRMLSRDLLERVNYRPAEEDRDRAIDTSVMRRLTERLGRRPRISYTDLHPVQIVDWKSRKTQLNSYAACVGDRRFTVDEADTWDALTGCYPAEALNEMRALYRLPVAVKITETRYSPGASRLAVLREAAAEEFAA